MTASPAGTAAAYLAGVKKRAEFVAPRTDLDPVLYGKAHAERGRLVADDVPVLVAALEAVLELHRKQVKPVEVTTLCPSHRPQKEGRFRVDPAVVSACPDCTVTEMEACAHCQCPHDEWPCLTYKIVEASLTGTQGGAG